MKEKIREILENNFRIEAIDKIAELIVNYKEFEPGWYWDCEILKKEKALMVYLYEEKNHYSFGFNPNFKKGDVFYSKFNIKATHDEVLEMFIYEAKRRGLIEGAKVSHKKRKFTVNVGSGNVYVLSDDMLTLYLNNHLIFTESEWAEVVKEESLDDLYDEYLNSLYVHNFLDFIKQNKEKFLIALNNL